MTTQADVAATTTAVLLSTGSSATPHYAGGTPRRRS